MNPLRPWGRAVAEYRRALHNRALFECYRVWRSRRPWRWLPQGPRFDYLRARAFRRFGGDLRAFFIPAWCASFEHESGAGPRGYLVAELELLHSSERAAHNLAARAEVELREIGAWLPRLADPDDSTCIGVTERVGAGLGSRTLRLFRGVVRDIETAKAADALPLVHGLFPPQRTTSKEASHGHRR